jgi:hypothetical protein
MSDITDEPESPADNSSGRAVANGRRVISNPTRRPDPEDNKLKTLIRNMRERQQARGGRRGNETDPPEAA